MQALSCLLSPCFPLLRAFVDLCEQLGAASAGMKAGLFACTRSIFERPDMERALVSDSESCQDAAVDLGFECRQPRDS